MTNLILHIVVPKGLTLVDGRTMQDDVTFDVVSRIDPFYCSIDQVRLSGGQILRKMSDLAIACQVYQSSQEADLITPQPIASAVINNPNNSTTQHRFIGSRSQWVCATATRDLILGQLTIIGGPQSHVLANFSVEKGRGMPSEGPPARLAELEASIKLYDPPMRSGGVVMPGGKPRSGMAAKGVYDFTDKTPSRTWSVTGLGANVTSWDFGSATGGRGKPTHFFSAPYYSPPFVNLRSGLYQGLYPLLSTSRSAYPGTI